MFSLVATNNCCHQTHWFNSFKITTQVHEAIIWVLYKQQPPSGRKYARTSVSRHYLFREANSSWKTVIIKEQIMSKDKYLTISFSNCRLVFSIFQIFFATRAFLKIGEPQS